MTARLGVLGPLEIRVDGQPRPVGGVTQRTVLARLVCAAGRLVTTDRLVLDVWGDAPPSDPGHALQSHVSRIRRALGETARLEHAPGGYRLDLGDVHVDAHGVVTLEARARAAAARGDVAGVRDDVETALRAWRGEPYQDVRESSAVRSEVVRLDQVELSLRELRARGRLAAGEHEASVPELVALVDDHPYREGLWLLLARTLDATGRTHEALETLRQMRVRLREDLGVDPGPAADDLYARLLRRDRTRPEATPELPGSLAVVRRGPCAGRDDVLDELVSTWRGLDRLGVALVSGEAGIGKTRLASELGVQLAGQGARVWHGTCSPDLHEAHEPFREALGTDFPEDARSPGAGSDHRARQHELAHGVARALVDAAPAGGLLVLDDLHWADQATLALLRRLGRHARAGRVLVLGTYRDTEVDVDPALHEAVGDLTRHGLVARVRLAPLARAAVGELVAARVPEGDVEAATERIHALSGGNPLFATALVREAARVPEGGDPTLPTEVRELVTARMAPLSGTSRRLLQTAATIGRDVDVAVLAGVLDASADEVVAGLDQAVAIGVLDEVAADRYRFVHDVVRGVVAAGVSRSRRTRVHRRAAAVLEARGASSAETAHHLLDAGDDPVVRGRAARALLEAGHEALGGAAPGDARVHFERAVRAATVVGDAPLARRARLGFATACRDLGDPDHRRALLELADEAEVAGDVEVLVGAALANHRGMWSTLAAVDHARLEVLDRARERATDPGDRARLAARVAVEAVFAPDRDPAALLDEAELDARVADDPTVEEEVLRARVTAGWTPATAPQLHEQSRRLVAVAHELGDRVAQAHAGMWHALHLRTVGRTREARRHLDAARAVAEELDHDGLRLFGAAYGCAQALLEGDVAGAGDEAEAARAHGARTGQPDVDGWYLSMRSMILLLEGRLAELGPLVIAMDESSDDPLVSIGPFQANVAGALLRAGRIEEGRARWVRVAEELPAAPRDFTWLQTAAILALVADEVGEPTRCRALHDLVAPHAGQLVNGGIVMWGAFDDTLGRLASASGDAEGAEAAFERARRLQEAAGARGWQAHTLLAHAAHVDRVGGDGRRASRLREDAMRLARELGLTGLVDAC